MKLAFLSKLTAASLLAGTAFAWAITPSAAQLIPSRAAIVDGQNTQIVETVQARRGGRSAVRQFRSGGRSAVRQFRSGRRSTVRQLRREARPVVRQRIDRRHALRADRRFDRHRFRHRHFRRFHDHDDVFISFGLAAPFVAAPLVAAPYVAAPAVGGCGSAVVVGPGDTLDLIAAQCGTTVGAILAVNPQIQNPHVIFAGQVINMP